MDMKSFDYVHTLAYFDVLVWLFWIEGMPFSRIRFFFVAIVLTLWKNMNRYFIVSTFTFHLHMLY